MRTTLNVKTCGLDRWTAYKKARDSRLRRRAAKDSERSDTELPEAGKSAVDNKRANDGMFCARFPEAFAIGKDNGYCIPERVRPTAREAVARARYAMDGGDSAGFAQRFPGAARIKLR